MKTKLFVVTSLLATLNSLCAGASFYYATKNPEIISFGLAASFITMTAMNAGIAVKLFIANLE